MKKNTLLILIMSVFIHLLPSNQIEAFAESALFSEMAISQAKHVQSKHEDSLMNQQGVQGVGIGQKDGRLGILVLLDKQANESQIPAQVDGLPVVIRKVGRIVAHKMNLGFSGGNDILCSGWCGTGTVGFKVCDNIASGGGWITNNHVAAAGCPGYCPNNAPLGTDMFSPGMGDNIPVCTTTGAINVGALKRFVPLILDSTTLNLVDAALVQSSDDLVSDYIQDLGPQNNEIADPFPGQIVCKSGRTTGVTCGTITGINITVYVEFGDSCGNGKFINQVMYLPSPPYTSMSGPGDSGAPVVDSNNKAVALNFAGGEDGDGYGSPIRTVLQELQVSLCSNINGASVSPSGGTIGTHFTITGSGFGTKNSFVYLEYEKNGVIKQARPKVTSWADTSITGIWNKTMPAGSYKMYVKPKAKGTNAIYVGTFIIKNPTIDEITPNSCSIGEQNTISGKFFSSIKPKVYLQNTSTSKKYSCKVSSFAMDPDTGDSSLQFSVPKVTDLDSGDYKLILQNKIGQANTDFCGPQTGSLKVINNYYLSITELYFSLSSSAIWGTNRLSSPIASGSSVTFPDITPGTYDLSAVASDGAHAEWWDLTIGAGQTLTWTLQGE